MWREGCGAGGEFHVGMWGENTRGRGGVRVCVSVFTRVTGELRLGSIHTARLGGSSGCGGNAGGAARRGARCAGRASRRREHREPVLPRERTAEGGKGLRRERRCAWGAGAAGHQEPAVCAGGVRGSRARTRV